MNRPKIRIIDDSVLMRSVLRGQLEEAGYAVEDDMPGSLLELADKIRVAPPDLVISDFHMPDFSGLDVAKTLRRAAPAIPVIILTAKRDADREAMLQTVGVRTVLHKPIAAADLLAVVCRVLGTPGEIRG